MVVRSLLVGFFACLLAAIGCGRKPSPSMPEPAPTQTTSTSSSADPSPTPPQPPTPPPAASTPTPAPAATADGNAKDGSAKQLPAERRALLAALIVPGQGGRWHVAETPATELEKSSPALGELFIAAEDRDPAVRRGAWHLLAEKIDASDEASRDRLRKALADEDGIVGALAYRIVTELPGQQLPAFVPDLANLVAREQLTPDNRSAIARLLGRMKEQAKAAEQPLAEAARGDQQPKVRAACLMALWQIAEPEANLPRFRAALQDGDGSVRVVAAARLREMGPPAAPAAESLAKLLEDREERVQEAAAEALIRIGEPAVKPLTAELAANQAAARRWAVFALAKLGPLAKPAQAELEKRASDEREEEETRKMAALAVKRLKE